MSSFEILKNLKDTIIDLITVLRNEILIHPDEKGDMIMVEFFFGQMHEDMIMQHVIRHVLPHSSEIKNREETFFVENNSLYSGLPCERISHYTNLVSNSNSISAEDRKEIWDYFDTIVALAESYRKLK